MYIVSPQHDTHMSKRYQCYILGRCHQKNIPIWPRNSIVTILTKFGLSGCWEEVAHDHIPAGWPLRVSHSKKRALGLSHVCRCVASSAGNREALCHLKDLGNIQKWGNWLEGLLILFRAVLSDSFFSAMALPSGLTISRIENGSSHLMYDLAYSAQALKPEPPWYVCVVTNPILRGYGFILSKRQPFQILSQIKISRKRSTSLDPPLRLHRDR